MGARPIVTLAVAMLASAAVNAEDKPPAPNYTFDQYTLASGATQIVALAPGQMFTITIAHGCPDRFDYSVFMSPASRTRTPQRLIQERSGKRPPANPAVAVVKGPIKYDDQYGSYIVKATIKNPAVVCEVWVNGSGAPDEPPAEAREDVEYTDPNGGHWDRNPNWGTGSEYVVAIDPARWEIGEDVAFVFSAGADRRFTTVAAAAANDQRKQIVEDLDGEAPGRFNFATLTHFYFPPRLKGIATGPTLGFSVIGTENNQTEYYFGWGIGFGAANQRLNVALGAALGPRATLPAGTRVGDIVADASAVSNVRNVYRWRFFFGVTATALRSGTDHTGKPAAPNPQP